MAVYLLFIYRPRLNLLFGGALGLAASTLSRSRTGAMTLSVLATGPLLIIYVGFVVWYVRSVATGDWLGQGMFAGVLAQAFAWLVPMGVVALGRLLLTPLMFALAVHRIGRLVG
jgi:hypothetical protein